MNAELCDRCEHPKEEHAEFIDNQIGSASYVPERRRCLHKDGCACHYFQEPIADNVKGSTGLPCECAHYKLQHVAGRCTVCVCTKYKVAQLPSEPHQVLPPSTGEEIEASDNKVIKDYYKKTLEREQWPVAVRSEPICESCKHTRYPGIIWPIDYNDGRAWIQRCDECDLFAGDHEAAYFLSAVTGMPIKLGEHHKDFWIFYTPIYGALVESMAKAMRF